MKPGMTLLFLVFGLQNSKLVSKYFDRKTADGTGAPLIQAGTEAAPADPVIVSPTAKVDEAQEVVAAV